MFPITSTKQNKYNFFFFLGFSTSTEIVFVDLVYRYEKGAYMFGRLDMCDFVLEHPTISRFHAGMPSTYY